MEGLLGKSLEDLLYYFSQEFPKNRRIPETTGEIRFRDLST